MQINISEAGAQARVYNTAGLLKHIQAQERAAEEKVREPIVFAHGRIKAVLSVLAYDHGGQCWTDDGIAYFDLVFPYFVELYHLSGEFDFSHAMRRVRRFMPALHEERGADWFKQEWDRLIDLRALAQARQDANPTTQGRGYLHWLPTAEQITHDLNLTRERRAAVNAVYTSRGGKTPIKGIGTVDIATKEEIRSETLVRVTKHRRDKGVKSQSERNKNAQFEDLAAWRGCGLSTIKRRDKNGTLTAYLLGEC